jgi:hypothetical protein
VCLLDGNALKEQRIWNSWEDWQLDAPVAALLADALRDNSTLTTLVLVGRGVDIWRDAAAATALLSALTGHPSLQMLDISANDVHVHAALAGAALGALVAANALALHELDVSGCQIGDAGLGPLVDALPANTHLLELDVHANGISDAFARDRLLPAVRANSGLRSTDCVRVGFGDAANEAEALVAARATEGAQQ